jgi:phospholipid:diacylglycerol acyltransferase
MLTITGTGKPTERAYFYRDASPLTGINVTIDTSITAGNVDHGIVLSEGDGTVNLLSMGYMCTKGWDLHRFNPAGAKIIVREMKHEPDRFNPRGGPNTGDHVDILGRTSLNELILRIAAGKADDVEDEIVSNIREYAERVEVYEEPEYLEKKRALEEETEIPIAEDGEPVPKFVP